MLTLLSPHQALQKLGSATKANRLSRGWSVAELADRSGIAPSTIKRFESTGVITTDKLIQLLIPLRMLDALLSGINQRDNWTLEQHERLTAKLDAERSRAQS